MQIKTIRVLQVAVILLIGINGIVFKFYDSKEEKLQQQNKNLKREIRAKSSTLAKLETDIKEKNEEITKIKQETSDLRRRIEEYGSVQISESDRLLLAKLVMAEAENQPFEGKVAIVSVVLNRLEDERFPKTIKDVIYSKKQFSPVSDGRINNNPTQECFDAVDIATYKRNENRLGGAVYFYNKNEVGKSRWFDSLLTVSVVGNHTFKK